MFTCASLFVFKKMLIFVVIVPVNLFPWVNHFNTTDLKIVCANNVDPHEMDHLDLHWLLAHIYSQSLFAAF